MPEYSSNTLIPTDSTKVPGMQGSNAGNFQLDALKAYILAEKAQANGLASLDADGKLNSSQIPASLDDVLVYASYASLPAVGESGKLYITTDVNGSYYWNGTSYQMLNNSFVRYRGTVSSLPSNPQTGDWFIAASTFTEGGVTYTSGAIYLYNGSSWDDATAVFGQFVRKSDISQTIGPEIDKVPSNAAVNGAINAIIQIKHISIEGYSVVDGLLSLNAIDSDKFPNNEINKIALGVTKGGGGQTISIVSGSGNYFTPYLYFSGGGSFTCPSGCTFCYAEIGN